MRRLLPTSGQGNQVEARRIKALALALLPAGTAVAVNEIICGDPACPGAEVVILIMRPKMRTVAARIRKDAAAIGQADIRAALEQAARDAG